MRGCVLICVLTCLFKNSQEHFDNYFKQHERKDNTEHLKLTEFVSKE